MGLILEPKEGDTLLSPEELEQLIPEHVTNRIQLDEVEQDNIEDALFWLDSLRTLMPEKIFSIEFQDQLHKKMLGKVWKWAGKRRTRETNIGVNPFYIDTNRRQLNDDALFWVEHSTWSPIETALRYHHKLVQIHCYPNGNGRHSRIMADIILERIYQLEPIDWLADDLISVNEGRKQYIQAMQQADRGNFELLFKCIKSKS